MDYFNLTKNELAIEYEKLKKEYEKIKPLNLNLNMARGKPSKQQLNLSLKMLKSFENVDFENFKDDEDPRNYGNLDGILKAKEIFKDILEIPVENIIVTGNSSLQMMYTYLSFAMQFGILNNTPWNKLKEVKFLCPCPGYDRHFTICELLGIKMINININDDGPNMEKIKSLVEEDELIKGIWCVPKYSNPTGITYKDEIVKSFAKLKPKAKDFRIFWDNAYAVHGFCEEDEKLLNIFKECEKHSSEDMVIEFTSTSKITFPGSGISAIAASKKNIENIKQILSKHMICFNLMNQLQHSIFLNSHEKLKNHMRKHAKIIKPKFDLVLKKFEENLKPLKIGNWTNPKGGYFISFNSLEGCAKKIFSLCKELGVTLTTAGATFPYDKDPKDQNIRIAPTYPSLEELNKALDVFCLAVKIASLEKLMKN